MKLKILSVDCPVTAKGIETFDFYTSPSFSDYDAVIIDTYKISEEWTQKIRAGKDGTLWTYEEYDGGYGDNVLKIMNGRSEETLLLLEKSAGIVICFLRIKGVVLNYFLRKGTTRELSRYSWIPTVWGKTGYISPYFKHKRRVGKGFGEINKAHPFSQYLLALKDDLYFEAVIEDQDILEHSTVIGRNRVGEVIALEIPIGKGKFTFLPLFYESADINKITGILIDCVRKSLQWSEPLVRPTWLGGYTIPGEEDVLRELEKLDGGLRKKRRGKGRSSSET